MNDLYKDENETFFAAANTKDGFVSYFDEIFDDDVCNRKYILKGGPGVGKSTFMKKLGKAAKHAGYTVEYFYCSSDPDSLDGIIITEKKIAVIDGTSPHAVEPKYSGARDIIIDLGRAWNTDKLSEYRGKIMELSDKKSRLYGDCYKYLYCKSVMDGILYNLTLPYILFDKLEKSSARLAKGIFKGFQKKNASKIRTRLIGALSGLGKVRLTSFENSAEYCIFLKEPFASSRIPSLFLGALYDYAMALGCDIYVSFSPENPDLIDALYFPEAKTSISVFDEKTVAKCDRLLKKCKIINCERFIDMKAFSSLKPLRKFYCRLSENMQKQALDCLGEAGAIHSQLEEIYGKCTDYKVVESISAEYFKKIL